MRNIYYKTVWVSHTQLTVDGNKAGTEPATGRMACSVRPADSWTVPETPPGPVRNWDRSLWNCTQSRCSPSQSVAEDGLVPTTGPDHRQRVGRPVGGSTS